MLREMQWTDLWSQMCWPFDRENIGSCVWSHRHGSFLLRWCCQLLQMKKETGPGAKLLIHNHMRIWWCKWRTCWILTSPDLASLFPGSISSTFSKSNKEEWHTSTHTHWVVKIHVCVQRKFSSHLPWLLLACQAFPGQLPSVTMPWGTFGLVKETVNSLPPQRQTWVEGSGYCTTAY